MADAAPTAKKQRADVLRENAFKPGQSGNPNGRAKGSRNKLGEAFLEALHDDFKEHGVQAIVDMREDSPKDYVKVIASTLPAQLNVKVSELDELTDDQIARQLAAGLAALAKAGFDVGQGIGPPPAPQPSNEVSTLQ